MIGSALRLRATHGPGPASGARTGSVGGNDARGSEPVSSRRAVGGAGGAIVRLLLRSARVIVKLAREGRKRRVEDSAYLTRYGLSLAPGLWVPYGRHVWRRLGAPLPPHLHRDRRASYRWSIQAAELRERTRPWSAARASGWATRIASVALPPWFRYVRARSAADAPTGFGAAVVRGDRHRVVLLDARDERVAWMLDRPLPDDYIALRRTFAAHVDAAELLEHGADWYVERLVAGRPFESLTEREQRTVLRNGIASFTALVAAEASPGPAERDESKVRLLEDLDPPDWIDRLMHGRTLAELFAASPIVPAHRDFGNHNLLVVGDRACCFDLDPRAMSFAPFWRDVGHWMLVGAGAGERWFRVGEFDADIDALCRTAGWEPDRPAVQRDRITALTLVERAASGARRAGREGRDPGERLSETLERYGRTAGLDGAPPASR